VLEEVKFQSRGRVNLVGTIIFIAWVIVMTFIFDLIVPNNDYNGVFSNQEVTWVIVGPLVFFIFAGRLLISKISGSVNKSCDVVNAKISLGAFVLWLIFLVVASAFGVQLYMIVNIFVGYAISLSALILYNKTLTI